MVAFLTILHVFICIFLIISILLQSSKGGGLAGMFGGGGGMGGVFGGRGAASFLSRVTLWLGIGFAVTTISIALLTVGFSQPGRSIVQQAVEQEQTASPAGMLPAVPGEEETTQTEQIPQGSERDQQKD